MKTSFSLTFENNLTAQILEIQPEEELTSALSVMNLTGSRGVLIIIGGASQMEQADFLKLQRLFLEVLAPLAQQLGLFVVDGGTDTGVMGLMGRAKHEIQGDFPLIGVSPIGLVKLPNRTNTAPEAAHLEPHHTHFFLVPGSNWGDESSWLARIGSVLAGNHPSVTVLINGGSISLVDAKENVKQHRPLIVVAGSGRLADRIAASMSQSETGISPDITSLINTGLVNVFDLSQPFGQLEALLREKLD